MGAVIGIVVILLLIGLAVWAGRGDDSGGNGDNRDSATRYGRGYNGQ
jgi:hypothetical protein